ncbi:MAG: hypothetical protein WCF04_03330 [Candidatus Nanopelagicales bacterium]
MNPQKREILTDGLRARVSTLIATARAAHPRCAGWQLTMNPETYLLLNPTGVITDGGDPVSVFDGCRVWPAPSSCEVVICTPMVAPGDWDLPPEHFLDLRQDTISTSRPVEDSGIGFSHASRTSAGLAPSGDARPAVHRPAVPRR